MVTTNRIELPLLAADTVADMPALGAAESAPPAKAKTRRPARKTRPASVALLAPSSPAPVPVSGAKPWAAFGVVFTLALSAGLNGYANAQHAPDPWAGWLMGVSVPIIVLVLSKVCGEKYRVGQRGPAYLAGGSGAALLFLSVWHCAESISLLTGSGLLLAVPMAVSIDFGLVACEVALISEPRDR